MYQPNGQSTKPGLDVNVQTKPGIQAATQVRPEFRKEEEPFQLSLPIIIGIGLIAYLLLKK